jgi:hypothetical protein
MTAPQQPPSTLPSYLQPAPGSQPPGGAQMPGGIWATKPYFTLPKEEPNRDILVQPDCGPWMILLISYEEQENEDVSLVARDLISELRSSLNLPAYAFNYGYQERRKEIERVNKVVEEKKAQYRQMGVDPEKVPIRVGKTRYKVEHAVLIGGYPSQEAAKQERERLKSCKLSEARRYRLESMFLPNEKGEPECVGYRNPFYYSMVVRNPTLTSENNSDQNKLDVALLKRLNEDESFSLFKNPRPYTLVVKQYALPGSIQSGAPKGGFLPNLGFGGASPVDAAKQNAHGMAETLRRDSKLDAFVLHTQYASYVTIGGFDSPEDPRMQSYQQAVARINENIRTRIGRPEVIEAVSLIPMPRPMAVPH